MSSHSVVLYKIELDRKANKFYQKADQTLAKKLNKCFENLEKDPYKHPNIKALKGNLKGKYRYRVGNYRVIYEVHNQQVMVLVLAIVHRGSAYE